MSPPVNFDKLVSGFLDYKRYSDGCSLRTVAAYRDILERFRVFLVGCDPREVTEEDLILFTGMYLNRQFGLHARSRVVYVACIRGLYAYMAERAMVASNPAERLQYPRAGRPLPDVLSQASAEKLLAAPDLNTFEGVRDAAIMALLIGCGLRLSGLVALNRSNLTRYQHKGRARMGVKVMEKGDKERIVPIPMEAELLLRIYLDHPDHSPADATLPDGDQVLFVNINNRHCAMHEWHGEKRRLSRRGVQRMIERYADKAGVPREEAHPHAARHLFGTELTEEDTPLQLTGMLLGHSSAESTRIYTHLAMRKATDVVDRGNPLGKITTPASELLRQLKGRFTI